MALFLGLAALLPTPPAAAAERTYRDAVAETRLAIAKGDLRLAEIDARNSVREFPNNPDVHLVLAQVLLRIGQSAEAEAEARLAQWHRGSDDQVTPVLAQAMLQQNELTDLIQQIVPGGREPKAEASVRLSLAMAHLALGDDAIGEELLRDAKRLDPDAQQSDLALARLQMAKGDLASAERGLAAIRAREPDSVDALRLEADLARAKGDTEGALAAYGKLLASHPDDVGLLTGRATILLSANRNDEAQKDVDAALKLAPQALTPNFLKGVLQASRGDVRGADDTLTSVSAMFDAVPNGYYVLGVVKYAIGQYDEAVYNLQHYVARQPANVTARRLLAASAMRLGDDAQAIQALRPVADAHPEDMQSIGLLAQAYLASGQKDEVVALYQRAAQGARANPKLSTQAAIMQLGLGDPQAGAAALEKIAATAQGLEIAGPVLVLQQMNSGQLDKAAATAQQMVARAPDDVTAVDLLGSVRLAQFDFAEAERLFRDAISRDPKFLLARRNLAQTYVASGQFERARSVDEDLLRLQPNDPSAMVALAELSFRAGDVAAAGAQLKKAHETWPRNLDVAIRLVHFLTGQKQWADAIAAAEDLLNQDPGNPDLLDLVASVQFASGHPEAAVKLYVSYIERASVTPALLRRLASYQRRAGDTPAAQQTLEQVLGLSPNDPQAIIELVGLAEDEGGADAAVKTAQAYQLRAPELTDILAANALERANRRNDAIAFLTEEQRWHPSPRIAGRLAELTYAAGKRSAAEAMLVGVIGQEDSVPARLALGSMYMTDGAFDKAQAQYERALMLGPNDPVALNNLAWLYQRKGDKRARELAIQAYRLAPNPQNGDTLGWVLERNGEHATALPLLEAAAAGLPRDVEVQYHLAAALQANGAVERAKTLLRQIVESKEPFSDRDDAARRLEALSRG
jgi:putative PEP-CTERM system TPR-repeat lipoprotein